MAQKIHDYLKQTGKTPLEQVTFSDLIQMEGGQAPQVDPATAERDRRRQELQAQLAQLDQPAAAQQPQQPAQTAPTTQPGTATSQPAQTTQPVTPQRP